MLCVCVDWRQTLTTAYRQTSFPHLLKSADSRLTPVQKKWVNKAMRFGIRQAVDHVNGSAPRLQGSDAERVDQLRHQVANDWTPWNVDWSVHVGYGAVNRTQNGTGISQSNLAFPYMYPYGQDYYYQGL